MRSFPAFQSNLDAFIEDDSDPDQVHPGDFASQESDKMDVIDDDNLDAPRSYTWYLPSQLKEKSKKSSTLEKLKRDKELRQQKKTSPTLTFDTTNIDDIMKESMNSVQEADELSDGLNDFIIDDVVKKPKKSKSKPILHFVEDEDDFMTFEMAEVLEKNALENRSYISTPEDQQPVYTTSIPTPQIPQALSLRIRVAVGDRNFIIPCNPTNDIQWLVQEIKTRYERLTKTTVEIENIEMSDGYLLSLNDTIGDVLRDNDSVIGKIGNWVPHPMNEMYDSLCKEWNYEFNEHIHIAFGEAQNTGKLDLSNLKISSPLFASMMPIIKSHKVTLLDLSWNSIDEMAIESFSDLLVKTYPSLKILRINSNRIGPGIVSTRFLENLHMLDHLIELDLSSNCLTDFAIMKLAKSLSMLQSLSRICLSKCCLTEKSLYYLFQNQSLKSSLKYLDISGNLLNLTGLNYLAKTLEALSKKEIVTIDHLDLSDCNLFACSSNHSSIRDENSPFQILFNTVTLHIVKVVLNNNPFPMGYSHVDTFSSIFSSPNLKEIHFANCSLSATNISILCEFIKKNSSLKVLVLDNNNLGEQGGICLSTILNDRISLCQLEILSLRSCHLNQSILALWEGLTQSNSLLEIDLIDNDLDVVFENNQQTALRLFKESTKKQILKMSMSSNRIALEDKLQLKQFWLALPIDDGLKKERSCFIEEDIFEMYIK